MATLIDKVRDRLCRDLLAEIGQSEDQGFAITSFAYPNGDSVNLYFDDLGDELAVSDEGTTLSFLRQQNVEITADRNEIIRSVCRAHEVEYQTPRLVKRCDLKSVGAASLELCEAVTQIAAIYFHAPGALRSPLPVAMDELLRKRVEPKRRVERRWTDRRHDPKGSFPVDFHVNGLGPPRNIFAVTSRSKSILVTAVVHFLRSHGLKMPTMSIIDPSAHLGPRDVNRLQLASTELRFGLDRHQHDIVDFALATDD